MKSKKVITLVFLAALLPSSFVFANETNTSFGDRSWQFKTPNDKLIDNQRLIIRCKTDPDSCPNGYAEANASASASASGGGGAALTNGQAIGNITNVHVVGDGNTITLTGDQTNNDSNQTVNSDVSDNVLDIDNDTQVLNGDVSGDVSSTDNSTNASNFDIKP